MEQELQRIKEEALSAIKSASDEQALQDVRVKYLGKKGEVTALLKGLGKLSPEERPKMGALVNAVRQALEEEIDALKTSMEVAATHGKDSFLNEIWLNVAGNRWFNRQELSARDFGTNESLKT